LRVLADETFSELASVLQNRIYQRTDLLDSWLGGANHKNRVCKSFAVVRQESHLVAEEVFPRRRLEQLTDGHAANVRLDENLADGGSML
jgi:hypothetical protein